LRGLLASVAAVAVASRLAPAAPKLELEGDFPISALRYERGTIGFAEAWTAGPISDEDYAAIGAAYTRALLASLKQRRSEIEKRFIDRMVEEGGW
jgi:hypothetical protein